jgi:hypothetical protein
MVYRQIKKKLDKERMKESKEMKRKKMNENFLSSVIALKED